MKKTIVLALAVLAMAAVAPSIAGADDVNGPRCADIASGNGVYNTDGSLNVILTLGDAPCRAFDYTVYVQTAEGLEEVSGSSLNETQLLFSTSVDETTNPTICVYATVSVGGGNHVFDLAPDVPKDCEIGLNVSLGDGFATSFN